MKKFRNPENIHGPVAGYTHQIEVSGEKRWLVLSVSFEKRGMEFFQGVQ